MQGRQRLLRVRALGLAEEGPTEEEGGERRGILRSLHENYVFNGLKRRLFLNKYNLAMEHPVEPVFQVIDADLNYVWVSVTPDKISNDLSSNAASLTSGLIIRRSALLVLRAQERVGSSSSARHFLEPCLRDQVPRNG